MTPPYRVRVTAAHLIAADERHRGNLSAAVRDLLTEHADRIDLADRRRDARFSIRLDGPSSDALDRLVEESGLTASEVLARAIEALAR